MSGSYTDYTAQTPLGELFRIGDIIQTEMDNFQSRQVCYLKASQGDSTYGIKKGQALYGDYNAMDSVNGDLSALAATTNDNETQLITIGPIQSAGTFVLGAMRYDGTWVQTRALSYNSDTSAVTTALNAVLGTSAVAATVTIGSASTAMTISVLFSGTYYAGIAQPLMTVDIISNTAEVAATASSIVRTPCCPTCIALEPKGYVGSVQQVLCVVRNALIKPDFVVRNYAGTALTAGDKANLRKVSNLIVMTSPTYRGSADAHATAETVTSPSNLTGL